MNFIKDILKGMVMGIANVIPGVSGGTLAVTMGIYDKMINAINSLLKKFVESVRVLLPLLLGMAIGIVGLSFAIEYLLENHPVQTNAAFIGLIIGGIPIIYARIKKSRKKEDEKLIGLGEVTAFVIFFAVIVGLQLISGTDEAATGITLSLIEVAKLFVVGIIASATMIIPGVSGSMILMLLGYYQPVIETINDTITALKDFDIDALLHGVGVLFPFGLGVLVGIFVIAKIISFLFEHFEKITYFAIMGLIVASPIAILMNTNFEGTKISGTLIAIICFILGFVCARLLGGGKNGDTDDGQEQIQEIKEY